MDRGALTEIVLEDAHHGGSGRRRRRRSGGGDPCSSEKRRIIHPAGFSAVAERSAPRLVARCFAGRRSRARAGSAATGELGAAVRGQRTRLQKPRERGLVSLLPKLRATQPR
jgi:hypothetical protein